MNTIIEPFRIKTVEPIRFTTVAQREKILRRAHYNPFLIRADDVLIDLLTDSGTSAMSAKQWAGMMEGDESYAGARSFFRFEKTVKELTGFKHVIPVHQGRAAEKILFTLVGGRGKVVPNNTHFDTTRANVEFSGATATDLPVAIAKEAQMVADFKGNMDVTALETFIRKVGAKNIPLVMITVTNNAGGGQPVSMRNIRETKAVLKKHGIPLFLDACRFAENAFFIKQREKGYARKSVKAIAQEMFSYADGCTMSAKKDAFANIGGFLAMNDDALAQRARNVLVITEGFPTYGGLAGRDLEVIAQGLEEVLDEHYLTYRIRSVAYLGDKLTAAGVPILQPAGGHAIYLDAKRFTPHIASARFPGQSIVCELYRHGGIRAVEMGSVMFGKYENTKSFRRGDGSSTRGRVRSPKLISPPLELVRLAIPRRVYTQSHMDYVSECIIEVHARREKLRGYRIAWEPPMLRHFTARFEPLTGSARPSRSR